MHTGIVAHRVATTLVRDGSLTLDSLPFRAGAEVEVIILARDENRAATENRYPLRGTRIRYERPADPVAEEDWEALR